MFSSHNPPIVKVADFGLAKAVDSLTMLKVKCLVIFLVFESLIALSDCVRDAELIEIVAQDDNSSYDHPVDSWNVGVIKGVIVFSMFVIPTENI